MVMAIVEIIDDAKPRNVRIVMVIVEIIDDA
jgi:hypothetical protein